MKATALDLRKNSKKIFDALKRREEVRLYYRGQEMGKIIPLQSNSNPKDTLAEMEKHPAFGMWKDHPESVEEFMARVRAPRYPNLFQGPLFPRKRALKTRKKGKRS